MAAFKRPEGGLSVPPWLAALAAIFLLAPFVWQGVAYFESNGASVGSRFTAVSSYLCNTQPDSSAPAGGGSDALAEVHSAHSVQRDSSFGPWKHWPQAMPMAHPRKESWERLQADPSLVDREPGLAREFEAAPWLLPKRTKALPYAGITNLDELAALRATDEGHNATKAVALVMFSKRFARMAQNGVYTMVKYGMIRNYIVAAVPGEDLEACQDLNLPCADVSPLLPDKMDKASGAGEFKTHDYLVTIWGCVNVISHLLNEGFTVMKSDLDIVYFVKPVWESYLRFIEAGKVPIDLAILSDHGSVSAGSFVVLPTAAAKSFFAAWAAKAPEGMEKGLIEQDLLPSLMNTYWTICSFPINCMNERRKIEEANATSKMAMFRHFPFNYYMYSVDNCELARAGSGVNRLFDGCDWSLMFLHPVCVGLEGKTLLFREQGFWYVDDESCGGEKGDPMTPCHPLRWRQEDAEDHLYACPEYHVGLVHDRPNRTLPGRPPRHPLPPPPALPDGGAGGGGF